MKAALSLHCKSFNTLFIRRWSTIKASEVGQDSVLVLCSLALARSGKNKTASLTLTSYFPLLFKPLRFYFFKCAAKDSWAP